MRIRYNAPVTLTFTLFCAAVLAMDQFLLPGLIPRFFAVPGRGFLGHAHPLGLLRLVIHVVGHSSWAHLMANFSFILLLGPSLEEKYGSGMLLFMMAITALITGLLNVILFSTGLMGASGIVFMMILLISFTNIREGEIPLTFILVVLLFLAKEIIQSFQTNTISEFAHIVGGIIGSLFGFITKRR